VTPPARLADVIAPDENSTSSQGSTSRSYRRPEACRFPESPFGCSFGTEGSQLRIKRLLASR